MKCLPVGAENQAVVRHDGPSEGVPTDRGTNGPHAAVHQGDEHPAARHRLQTLRLALFDARLVLDRRYVNGLAEGGTRRSQIDRVRRGRFILVPVGSVDPVRRKYVRFGRVVIVADMSASSSAASSRGKGRCW